MGNFTKKVKEPLNNTNYQNGPNQDNNIWCTFGNAVLILYVCMWVKKPVIIMAFKTEGGAHFVISKTIF